MYSILLVAVFTQRSVSQVQMVLNLSWNTYAQTFLGRFIHVVALLWSSESTVGIGIFMLLLHYITQYLEVWHASRLQYIGK